MFSIMAENRTVNFCPCLGPQSMLSMRRRSLCRPLCDELGASPKDSQPSVPSSEKGFRRFEDIPIKEREETIIGFIILLNSGSGIAVVRRTAIAQRTLHSMRSARGHVPSQICSIYHISSCRVMSDDTPSSYRQFDWDFDVN